MNDVSRKEITVEDINLQEFISEYEMRFKASMMRKENDEDASKSKKKRLVMKEGDSE